MTTREHPSEAPAETFTEWGIEYHRYNDGKLAGYHVSEYGEDEAMARKDMHRVLPSNCTKTLVCRTVTHTDWAAVYPAGPDV